MSYDMIRGGLFFMFAVGAASRHGNANARWLARNAERWKGRSESRALSEGCSCFSQADSTACMNCMRNDWFR
jgi:hypothetical protein